MQTFKVRNCIICSRFSLGSCGFPVASHKYSDNFSDVQKYESKVIAEEEGAHFRV